MEDTADRALEEAGLDKDGIQRVISRGGELQTAVVEKLRELSADNQYADEERRSNYGYLSGYNPKGITEQTNRLHELFPGLNSADEQIASQPVPNGAEGWFAIPRWDKIAPTYGEAVQKVLDLIKQTRNGKFYNYREGQLGPNQLRQHERTVAMFRKLGDQQTGHDILLVAAQFGLHHRGRSVRRVRVVFNASEFGLGAYEVGIMLLTHPERLQHFDDLWLDCAGDEYDYPGVDGRFDGAPYFDFDGGGVRFASSWVGSPHAYSGSASAVLPQ